MNATDRRYWFTKKEVIVVLIVLALCLALVPPAVLYVRERARRMNCTNNLKQIGLGLHNYAQANKVLPPGTVCTSNPLQPSNEYDVWAEASQAGPGPQGTGFLLRIFPFIEGDNISRNWNFREGISSKKKDIRGNYSNYDLASDDVNAFYCPTRRSSLRPSDKVMMLSTSWSGGGTDYGGCVGRHVAYDTSSPSHQVLDAGAPDAIVFNPGITIADANFKIRRDSAARRWGIFGRVNVSTAFAEIKNGTSNTLMAGELQRIAVTDANHGSLNNISHDGWVVGGDATGFTTGYGGPDIQVNGPLMNNGFFQSPGSEHPGGANFGLADGSVQFFSTAMDPNIFALLGSCNNGFNESRLTDE